MEITIYGSIMIQFPIVTLHHSVGRKINRENSDIQIGVVQNFSRFSSIKKHFRVNLVMTNNICQRMKNNLISLDNLSENLEI